MDCGGDCPPCESSSSSSSSSSGGGGGGGGGGGAHLQPPQTPPCQPQLVCEAWQPNPCAATGTQTRTCTDTHQCSANPIQQQRPCTPPISCSDGVQNGDEEGVDCSGSCTACPQIEIQSPAQIEAPPPLPEETSNHLVLIILLTGAVILAGGIVIIVWKRRPGHRPSATLQPAQPLEAQKTKTPTEEWIAQAVRNNVPREIIRDKLRKRGWGETQIKAVLPRSR